MGLFKPKKPSAYPSTLLWFFDQVKHLICPALTMIQETPLNEVLDACDGNGLDGYCARHNAGSACCLVLDRCAWIITHWSVRPLSFPLSLTSLPLAPLLSLLADLLPLPQISSLPRRSRHLLRILYDEYGLTG